MQECFKQYPEIYGAELADDEEEGAPETDAAAPLADAQKVATESPVEAVKQSEATSAPTVVEPKKAQDATDANNKVEEKQAVSEQKESNGEGKEAKAEKKE